MNCENQIYSENVLNYVVRNYESKEELEKKYGTGCYQILDEEWAVIYQERENVTNEEIRRYGYLPIPKCYGLMDQSALESSGVLRLRRQPYLDLMGQGTLIGFVDTGIDVTHPAFISADGTSRIVGIWDQTLRKSAFFNWKN